MPTGISNFLCLIEKADINVVETYKNVLNINAKRS